MAELTIITADYHKPEHAQAIASLMQCYAKDPFGGGKALSEDACQQIASELGKRDYAFSLIGFVEQEAVALINCFETFSTFVCKPLINIHDIVVKEDYRGRGYSHALLQAVETIGVQRGCCKLTLEVLSNNEIAKSSYQKFGFGDYQLNPEHGHALFWQKTLAKGDSEQV